MSFKLEIQCLTHAGYTVIYLMDNIVVTRKRKLVFNVRDLRHWALTGCFVFNFRSVDEIF